MVLYVYSSLLWLCPTKGKQETLEKLSKKRTSNQKMYSEKLKGKKKKNEIE